MKTIIELSIYGKIKHKKGPDLYWHNNDSNTQL